MSSSIGGLLNFVDQKNQSIYVGAISNTPIIETAIKMLPKGPSEYSVPLTNEDNISTRAIRERKIVITESFYDVVTPALPKVLAVAIHKLLRVKSIMAVPVYSEAKIIGVIDFVMKKNV